MQTISNFLHENFDYIILTIIIIFTVLITTSILEINFNFTKNITFNEEPSKVINVETMQNIETMENNKNKNKNKEFSSSFCSNYENNHLDLNKKCKNFNFDNCNSTRCTVWVKSNTGDKCMAGDSNGPHFKGTLENPLKIDNYYYKNKCIPGLKKC